MLAIKKPGQNKCSYALIPSSDASTELVGVEQLLTIMARVTVLLAMLRTVVELHSATIGPKERAFWSFQPLKPSRAPSVTNSTWAKTPVDRFILAKLESAGLTPAPPASRQDWIRRVAFDLTGLPPSPEDVAAFVKDPSPDAHEKYVDRLLSSPAYGERWAQHWLDVVRFAETEGFEYDRPVSGAWRFRDFVIRSFREDLPYDDFLTAQLAGDELAPQDREMQIAAGFHRVNPVRRNASNQDVSATRNEVLTERTDMIGAAFLGVTVGCARCHDHKFDPITQKDYYQMQAFLAATQENDIPCVGPDEHAAWKSRTETVNEEIARLKESLKAVTGEAEKRLREKLKETEARLPDPLPSLASIKNDPALLTPIHLLKRGDPERKEERVGMKGLSVLLPDGAKEMPPETPNPRTALARWMTDPRHPLTARVIANRIWQHHFGAGLVRTPNDFGANGDRPSHPELLDYLAGELIRGGWKLKRLHRLLVTSASYRQAVLNPGVPDAKARASDPDNRWLSHFNRRRLEAEELRDAMLAVSGMLDRRSEGESVLLPVDSDLVDELYKPTQWRVTEDRSLHYRRSIYLIAKRNLRLPFMQVFDQPMLQTSCPRRESSTHAPQALEMLNGRTANELANAFAARLKREAGADPRGQVERAYLLAVGRAPTPAERDLALEFLKRSPLKEFALATFSLNAFMYVE